MFLQLADHIVHKALQGLLLGGDVLLSNPLRLSSMVDLLGVDQKKKPSTITVPTTRTTILLTKRRGILKDKDGYFIGTMGLLKNFVVFFFGSEVWGLAKGNIRIYF